MKALTRHLGAASLTFTLGISITSLWLTFKYNFHSDVRPSIPTATVKPVLVPSQSKPCPSQSPIRGIDFENFTYPRTADLRTRRGNRSFTRKDGEFEGTKDEIGMYMADVVYADITGDGAEDAIVSLGVESGGSAISNCVYIYTLKDNRLKLLWAFSTGDRADGGLRRIYGEDGQLTIELYGKGTRIGGELYGTEPVGACCATSVTRTRYEWNGKNFKRLGDSEVFLNPASNSSYVGLDP